MKQLLETLYQGQDLSQGDIKILLPKLSRVMSMIFSLPRFSRPSKLKAKYLTKLAGAASA